MSIFVWFQPLAGAYGPILEYHLGDQILLHIWTFPTISQLCVNSPTSGFIGMSASNYFNVAVVVQL